MLRHTAASRLLLLVSWKGLFRASMKFLFQFYFLQYPSGASSLSTPPPTIHPPPHQTVSGDRSDVGSHRSRVTRCQTREQDSAATLNKSGPDGIWLPALIGDTNNLLSSPHPLLTHKVI